MRVRRTLAAALLALHRRRAVCVTYSVRLHTSTSSVTACNTDRNSVLHASCPTRRVTPTRLNGRSRRMRDLLLAHAARSATHARDTDGDDDDARLLLIEEVMDELRQRTHTDTQEVLHPLLCVELLRRLGPAVITEQHTKGGSRSDGRGVHRRRGWAVPCMNAWSMTNTSSNTLCDTPGSPSSTVGLRTMYEEVVIKPLLLPMLTRWAAAQTCETAPYVLPAAVRHVLPCLVEWLAVLPCLFVRHSTGSEGEDNGEGVQMSEDMWSNVHASWAVIAKYYSKQQQQQLEELQEGKGDAQRMCECGAGPTLAQLLPYILLTASTIGKKEGTKQGVQTDTVVDTLVQLFALVQDDKALSNNTTTALQTQETNSRALADVLFWQTDVPLLSYDMARRAYMAYTQQHVQDNITCEELPKIIEQTTCHTHRCVLRVDVPNDDAFRRFLLRLEALQGTLATHTKSVSERVERVVYLEPHLTQSTQCNAEDGDDEGDIVLRLVLPLHDYLLAHVPAAAPAEVLVSAGHTKEQGCVVQLGFEGVVHVLTAILDRMQALRRKSKCTDLPHYNNTTADNDETEQLRKYTLLPHKPRVHALKRICERLLQHARWAESAARTQKSTLPTARVEKRTVNSEAYFTDVPAAMQVAVLRRMCGASRALVRLVMREKQDSLLEDGSNNNNNNNSNSDVIHGGAMQSGGAVTSRALGEVLRNVAYRLIEPELRRYYETYNVLNHYNKEGEEDEIRGRSRRQGQQVHPHRTPYEYHTQYEGKSSYDTAYVRRSSLTSLYTLIGKDGALATARTILRHPSAHPTHALVEAIRLMGMHSLLFHHSLHSVDTMDTLSGSNENINIDDSELTPMMEELLRGFDCVWQRIEGVAEYTADHLPNTAEADQQVHSTSTLPTLSERLLMLVLLVLRQTCLLTCSTLNVHPMKGDAEQTENASPNMSGVQDVLLRRLLTLWTHNGSRTEWAPFLSLLSYLPSDNNYVSLYFPPAALPSGCQERWEFVEELRCLATPLAFSPACNVNEVHEERGVKDALHVVTWRWLSSAQAIEHSVQDIHTYTSHTQSSNSTNGNEGHATPYVLYLLLPWSTLASARHPLRLYDEDGRSAAAAAAFDRTLHRLLSCGTANTKNEETNNNNKKESTRGELQIASHPSLKVVVRLVSLAEELRFFALLTTQAELALAPDVLVVQDAESMMAAGQERDVVCEMLGRRKAQTEKAGQAEEEQEEDDMYDEFAALD